MQNKHLLFDKNIMHIYSNILLTMILSSFPVYPSSFNTKLNDMEGLLRAYKDDEEF